MRPRYFVSPYTDGPSLVWNVIDRQSQEWIRRFPTEQEAAAYADELTTTAMHRRAKDDGVYEDDDGQPDEMQEWSDYDRDC